jgi:tetratricopeptide (TPR) repeat protein
MPAGTAIDRCEPSHRCESENTMGNLDRYFGRIVDCLSFIDDPRKRMTILGDRAAAAARNGDYRAAHSLAARALWMARRYNDTQIEAWAWSQAGMYFWEAEEYPKARKAYQESLALYQESGDAEGIALGSRAVGSILIEEGDIKNAEPLLLRSIGIYRKLA